MTAYWIIQLVSMAVLTAIVVVAVRRYKIETDALTRVLLARANAGGVLGVEHDQLPAPDAIEPSGDESMQREHPPVPEGRGVETATRPADTRSTWSGLVAGICTTGVLALGLLFWLDWQVATLAVAAGVVIGGVVAVAARWRVLLSWTPAEIRRHLRVPVFGYVPRFQLDTPPTTPSATGLDPLLACFLRPRSPESEAVRGVRTHLYFSTQGGDQQVIQVTSPSPGDGKSTLAANLAISIAQSGKRVVLLDCDFRKPRVHRLFNLSNPEVGLASVIAVGARLDAAIRGCEVPNLSLVSCGPRPANPAELLTSPAFQEVLIELRGRYDFVVIDSPPLLTVSDPLVIARLADGVILVLGVNKTTVAMAEQALERLADLGARLLGVVVNATSDRTTGDGGYRYSYGYAYQYATPEHRPADTQSDRRPAEDSPGAPPKPSEPAPSPEHLR
jgi:capsular exopolysaccharide synthesis family protein